MSQITKGYYPGPAKINISHDSFWTKIIFLHAYLPVVYYKCVKFHQYRLINQKELCIQDIAINKFNYLPCDRTNIIFLHALPQVIYYNCVNFHKYWFICLRSCAYEKYRQTDEQTGWFQCDISVKICSKSLKCL